MNVDRRGPAAIALGGQFALGSLLALCSTGVFATRDALRTVDSLVNIGQKTFRFIGCRGL